MAKKMINIRNDTIRNSTHATVSKKKINLLKPYTFSTFPFQCTAKNTFSIYYKQYLVRGNKKERERRKK